MNFLVFPIYIFRGSISVFNDLALVVIAILVGVVITNNNLIDCIWQFSMNLWLLNRPFYISLDRGDGMEDILQVHQCFLFPNDFYVQNNTLLARELRTAPSRCLLQTVWRSTKILWEKRRFIINRHRKLRTLKFILHSLFVVFFHHH